MNSVQIFLSFMIGIICLFCVVRVTENSNLSKQTQIICEVEESFLHSVTITYSDGTQLVADPACLLRMGEAGIMDKYVSKFFLLIIVAMVLFMWFGPGGEEDQFC